MSWTDARVSILEMLWGRGLSASQIARQIGGITRSAVIGKASRLGLERHPAALLTVYQRTGAMSALTRGQKAAKPKPVAVEALKPPPKPLPLIVEPPRAPPSGGVAICDLEFHHCRWPLGPREMISTHFCGADRSTIKGELKAYCSTHFALGTIGKPVKPIRNPEDFGLRRRVRAA